MKLIKLRKKIDVMILVVALAIATMPAFGLLSETAISFGLYGANYQEISLHDNPSQYWFVIKVELAVTFYFLILSIFRFPLFEELYRKMMVIKEKNKISFNLFMYIAVPIFATTLIILIMALSNI